MTVTESLKIRIGTVLDLPAVNAVIEAAVMTWDLPERVKRLSLPSYRYDEQDLEFLELIVATNDEDKLQGVAALEPADPADAPVGRHTLLLHSIYVLPDHQHQGIGRKLLHAAEDAAAMRGYDSLMVKAQPSAEGFFIAQGLTRLPVNDVGRDYPHRFWKML